jgi:hypothetical protein
VAAREAPTPPDAVEVAVHALTGIDADAPLHRYVQGVLCRVAGEDCRRLRLYLRDGHGLHAASAPEGVIVLYTGALLRLRNEDELAFLLAHEVAHVRAQHAVTQREQPRGRRAAAALARDHEREADAVGQALATSAGYDGRAAAALWLRQAREDADAHHAGDTNTSRYPDARERAVAARERERKPAHTVDPGSAERYRAAIEPFLTRWLLQELDANDLHRTLSMLTDLHADAPIGWRGRVAFALGEAHRRRGAGDDAAVAATLFDAALREADAPAEAYREWGVLRRAASDIDAASDALARFLEMAGDAPDRAFFETEVAAVSCTAWPDGELQRVTALRPREHLVARRHVRRDASPGAWYDQRLRPDEWPRMLLAAFRDAGWFDVAAGTIRPARIDGHDGVCFTFTMQDAHGLRHAGHAAMIERDGRLTVAYRWDGT